LIGSGCRCGEPGEGVEVEEPGHEERVGAGGGVGVGAGDDVVEAAVGVADAEQENVRTGIDHELAQAGALRGHPGAVQPGRLVVGGEQRSAGGVGVFEVHADRAGSDDRFDGRGDVVWGGSVAAFDVGGHRDGDRSGDPIDVGDHLGARQRLAVGSAQ